MKLTNKQIDIIKHCLEDCANSDDWRNMRSEIYEIYNTLTDKAQ